MEVDPRVILEPAPEIRIREVNPTHVETLRESFWKTRTKNPNVSVVALGYKGVMQLPELIKFGLQAWEGLHTTKALSKIATKMDKNPFWQTYMVDVYICEDTSENRRVLRLVGNLSNFKSSVHLGTQFDAVLKMQHDQMYAERARLKIKDEQELPKTFVDQIKRDWEFSTGQSMATINQIWNLAKHRGPLWERIWKIVSGKVDNPEASKKIGFRPPKSCHHFNFMYGIEEDTLIELMDEVIRSEVNTKTFMIKCQKVKAIKRIRREILEWLNNQESVPTEMKTTDWDVAVQRFPALGAQDFFDQWDSTFITRGERDPPPSQFWEQLESRFRMEICRLDAVHGL